MFMSHRGIFQTNLYQTLLLYSLALSSNLCSGLFYIPLCITFLSGIFSNSHRRYYLVRGINRQPKTFVVVSLHKKLQGVTSNPIDGRIEGDQITNQGGGISSACPSEWLGELRMANLLGPARAAKSCRVTGNEGRLESKQTACREVSPPAPPRGS